MNKEKIFLYISGGIIIAILIMYFVFITNPITERNKRIDERKVNDINMISNEINNYYNRNDLLPISIKDVDTDSLSLSIKSPLGQYEYKKLNEKGFEICTTFLEDTENNSNYYDATHDKGYDCIEYDVILNGIDFPAYVQVRP